MPDTNQVTVYEDESTVEVRLLSDPTDVDSEPRKWKPNTVYTIAIDDGAIMRWGRGTLRVGRGESVCWRRGGDAREFLMRSAGNGGS